jgi:flavin reductase
MNRNSSQHDIFKAAGIFCVNILTPDQEELSPVFAGKMQMEERFKRAEWIRLATGAPVLNSAAAALDCTISQVVEVGTHSVIFGAVQAIHLGVSGSGLIYHGRAYHKILTQG